MIAIGAEGWADSSPAAAEKQKTANEYHDRRRAEKLMLRASRLPDHGPQAGFTRLGLMAVLAILVVPLMMAPSCGSTGTIGAGSAAVVVIDCTTAHTAEIAALFVELKNILTGTADWTKIEDRAVAAGEQIGGCAIAELVQDYLGGRVSAPVGEGQVARRTLEDFRANHAHNSTFHTPAGDL